MKLYYRNMMKYRIKDLIGKNFGIKQICEDKRRAT